MEFLNADLKSASTEELEQIIAKNIALAKELRSNIHKIELSFNEKIETSSSMIEPSFPDAVAEDEKSKPSFEEDIEYYMYELENLKQDATAEDLEQFLPPREDANYKDILLRLKLELLRKKSIIYSYTDGEEELSLFRDELQFYDKILSLLSSLDYSMEPLPQSETNNHLIFVPTSNGSPRAIEEIESINSEYYPAFLNLFQSIKAGTLKNFKRLSASSTMTQGLSEVKDFKIRIIIDRLGPNDYAIISAFVKKTDTSKSYSESLNLRCSTYKRMEHTLKSNLSNPEFVSLQETYEKELFSILGSKKEAKEKVKQ